MDRYAIAVLPGDGVGPAVIREACRVLESAAARFGFGVDLQVGLIGQAALDDGGKVLPPQTLRLAKDASAVLVGPVGGSRWEESTALNHPKQGLIKLRAWLGSYATVRPIRLSPCLVDASPLSNGLRRLDVLVVYDHSSGLYYGTPRGIEKTATGRMATNTSVYSDTEIARTARIAFEAAKSRGGKLDAVDQAKYLETGQLWRDTLAEVARDYTCVTYRRHDAVHFQFELLSRPPDFDVIVTEMGLGQLIAASCSAITGTFVLHPAAYLGGEVPLFQPSHGAALDLVDQETASPLGAIRAVAMLLDHALGRPDAAAAVEVAVMTAIGEGFVPPDVAHGADHARRASTREVGDAVVRALEAEPPSERLRQSPFFPTHGMMVPGVAQRGHHDLADGS